MIMKYQHSCDGLLPEAFTVITPQHLCYSLHSLPSSNIPNSITFNVYCSNHLVLSRLYTSYKQQWHVTPCDLQLFHSLRLHLLSAHHVIESHEGSSPSVTTLHSDAQVNTTSCNVGNNRSMWYLRSVNHTAQTVKSRKNV